MAQKIQLRRNTAAFWTAQNPVLLDGEECYEKDTGKRKVGDGVTRYNVLPYDGSSGGASVQTGALAASTTAAPNATAVQTALSGKTDYGHGHSISVISGAQASLVSGSNIKTVNRQTLLGTGDLAIAGVGASTAIDGGTPSSVYGGTTSINGGTP